MGLLRTYLRGFRPSISNELDLVFGWYMCDQISPNATATLTNSTEFVEQRVRSPQKQ